MDVYLLRYSGKEASDREKALTELDQKLKLFAALAEETPSISRKIAEMAKKDLSSWGKELEELQDGFTTVNNRENQT